MNLTVKNESKFVFNSLMMHCMIKIMIKQKNTTDACACDLPVSVFACSPGNHRYQPWSGMLIKGIP